MYLLSAFDPVLPVLVLPPSPSSHEPESPANATDEYSFTITVLGSGASVFSP